MIGRLVKLASDLLGATKAARSWLTLVFVAVVAAWLYWQFATVTRERDQLLAFAEVTCASAGAPFPASIDQVRDAKGKPATVKRKRGDNCVVRVRYLAKFELDATRASNAALAGTLQQHNTKSAADASAAARRAASAEAAALRMEQANNAISSDNRVTRHWFDALNDLAGLRAPGT